VQESSEAGEAAVIVTIVKNASALNLRPSQRMIVTENGYVHGDLDARAVEVLRRDGLRTIQARAPRLRSYAFGEDGLQPTRVQGGEIDVYFDLIPRVPRLIVVGGGHIAVPLVRIARVLDFEILVLDDRPQFADPARFPDADAVLCGPYSETLKTLNLDRDAYVVLVTRGHVHDAACLREVARFPVAYVGMIGSKMRVRTVLQGLIAEGLDREQLNAVHAPIGIDIGSTTPAEIAVAIVAEMIKVRRGGSAASLKNAGR
jgi:xanthine dehydrogenase accessory factor